MVTPDTAVFGFTGALDPNSVTRICSAFNHAVNNSADWIYPTFSSLGAVTADGIDLYNHKRAMPIANTIHAPGDILSVAVAAFLGAERRLCSKHVLLMIHPNAVPGSTEGMVWSCLSNLRNAALAEKNRTDGILRERCSIPSETLKARCNQEVHFSPEDALEFGISQEIQEFALPRGTNLVQI